MSDGQLAMNTNLVSPGLFLKDSNGDLVKVGPVHVGTTAPNATPGAGGQAGNSKGEQWLDTSSSRYVFKIWDGTAWRSEDGEFVNASGDTMTGALGIIAGTAAAPSVFFSGDTNTGIYSPGADQLAVSTGGTGRLFVDSAGDVGIGISAPTAQLHVVNAGTNDSFIVEDNGSDTTPFRISAGGEVFTGSRLVVGAQEVYNDGSSTIGIAQINAAGPNNGRIFSHIHWGGNPTFRHCSTPSTTLGTHTISVSGNIIGNHEFYGSDGNSFIASSAFRGVIDGTPAPGVMPGALTFNTAPSGTLVERMRIRSDGNIGIGGVGNAAIALYNQKDITGSTTAYANWSVNSIQSDVTTSAYVYRTQITTAAAAFTVANAFHYAARQIALGASSAITNQYGFQADATLTGATNNYGFNGGLASAAGCWNFYATGTAPNYFAGDVRTNTVVTQRVSPANSNGTTTLAASALLNGIVTGTPTTDINYNLPTGTNMDAAFQELQANQSFEWSVINLATAASGFDVIVTANTDHTVVGRMVVTGETSGRFLTRKTAANTFITYRIA